MTTYAWDAETLELITRRPFFLLISVDAPLGVRWMRLKKRYRSRPGHVASRPVDPKADVRTQGVKRRAWKHLSRGTMPTSTEVNMAWRA